jgi:2,4-didehydro-3-deoxy-L-rhamnonate hydrolase
MKLCRFDNQRVGLLRGTEVLDVTPFAEEAIATLPAHAIGDPLIASLPALRDLLREPPATSARPLSAVRLLAPVQAPGKLVGAPVNYKAHIAEMHASNVSPGHDIPDIDRAGLFLKATSSLVGPSQGIALRFPDRRTDYEVELAVVIGKTADHVTRDKALSHVAGYCLGLDITLRGAEDRSFRKSIDSYSVLGPWLTLADEIDDPDALQISLTQNGEPRQNANTRDLIFGVARLIEFASTFYTLHPGDVIYTGTPEGVGPIRAGDLLHAECAPLGAMDVAVRLHRPAMS